MFKTLLRRTFKLASFVALAISGILLIIAGVAVFQYWWQNGGAFNVPFFVAFPIVGIWLVLKGFFALKGTKRVDVED